MGEFSFPRTCRITETHDYRRIYRQGKRVSSASFLLFYQPAASGQSRIGFSSGTKVGNAVVRNRIKRRMREIMRRCRPRLVKPTDIVLVAHPAAAGLAFSDMEREITRMLKTARLITETCQTSSAGE